jgi:hypothetical protein
VSGKRPHANHCRAREPRHSAGRSGGGPGCYAAGPRRCTRAGLRRQRQARVALLAVAGARSEPAPEDASGAARFTWARGASRLVSALRAALGCRMEVVPPLSRLRRRLTATTYSVMLLTLSNNASLVPVFGAGQPGRVCTACRRCTGKSPSCAHRLPWARQALSNQSGDDSHGQADREREGSRGTGRASPGHRDAIAARGHRDDRNRHRQQLESGCGPSVRLPGGGDRRPSRGCALPATGPSRGGSSPAADRRRREGRAVRRRPGAQGRDSDQGVTDRGAGHHPRRRHCSVARGQLAAGH